MMMRAVFLPPLLALCVSSQLACSSTPKKDVNVGWAGKAAAELANKEEKAGGSILTAAELAKLAPPATGPLFFAYDDHQLDENAQVQLTDIADHLLADPAARVTIEGHCDDRGSSAYNLSLGDRRAQAAKAYLMRLGVKAERISIVSFGEEMPAVEGTSEEARAQNRRDEVTYFRAESKEASLEDGELMRFDVDWEG